MRLAGYPEKQNNSLNVSFNYISNVVKLAKEDRTN